jgi:hypothetical protein
MTYAIILQIPGFMESPFKIKQTLNKTVWQGVVMDALKYP